jgi:uncharacterized protein YggE
MRRTGLLLLAMSVVAAPASAQQVTPPSPPVIVTHGEAVVKRAPDQAWVSIAAETRASTAAEAQRLAADAMTAVQTAVSRAGIPGSAIRTTRYSLQPDMEYSGGRSRVRGYIARNQIEVRVDDLSKLSGVLDASGGSGATQISGPRFDVRDRPIVEREALKLAVQDALARARAIASGAGADLGAIVRIDEERQMEGPMPMYRVASAGADATIPTPVSPGDLEIRAQVMLTVAMR